MKTVGIAIDPWKLESFKKGLDDAGFNYRVYGKETDPFMTIKVFCPDDEVFTKLAPLVKKMNLAAAN